MDQANDSPSTLVAHELPQKAIIKNVDMSEEMQQRAVDTCFLALERYNVEKDVAMYVKKEFDRMYGTTWHCIVGKNFGSFVTHEARNFIYFYLGKIAFMLWKTT
ncbi:dynein light chain in complex with an in vitro evolved peptide dimerized By leucine zipper [Naematelia encephala]|uniref:Dynein light chain n=1 Tax=Naematelia encephala TaxID=71784 RepID=A0A1Y2BE07_9TREE|nr:dynein light chain in complex with an in vitro evolved peptide dimerized By leucine zipper [Naematelia encephala]